MVYQTSPLQAKWQYHQRLGTTPFLFFCYCLVPCQKHAFTHTSHGVIHTNVKSGTFKKTRTFFKKNKSFFKNVLIFLPCMKCQELYDHIPWKYKPFTHTFSSQKAKKRPTLHQAGISYKKVYITDNKHVIRKNASKRSEGMRV